MPFTPTHILAIVPIAAVRRLPLPLSALVIGSTIPDLPLFMPMSPGYETTHSVAGLVTACLPLGLVGFLLFQWVMKRPLFALLPAAVRRRCASLMVARWELRPESLAWASLAVVIGAATHLFWDSFTHRGRWGTRLFPALNEAVTVVGGVAVSGSKVFQYGSTLVGLPCLALVVTIWLCRQTPEPFDHGLALGRATRISVCLVVLAVSLSAGLVSWCTGDATRYHRLGSAITSSGLALMIATLVYCIAYQASGARILRLKSGGDRLEDVPR